MKTFTLATILACATALPTLVAAECLDQSALSRGVDVYFTNGDRNIIRRAGDGTVQLDEYFAGNVDFYRFSMVGGVHIVNEFGMYANGQMQPNTAVVTQYITPLNQLPRLEPGLVWSENATNIFDDGYRRNQFTTVTVGAQETLSVPGCDYPMLPVTVRYDWGPDGFSTFGYQYIPQLDIALLVMNQADNDPPFNYTVLSIERFSK